MVKMSKFLPTEDILRLPMSLAKDEEFRQISFELQDFGFSLFRDSFNCKDGLKELPKMFESPSYEVNDFFGIFDNPKTNQPIKGIDDNETIDFIGSRKRLLHLFDELDDQYFDGRLNKNRILISWSAALQKDRIKIYKKGAKTVSIKVSTKLFKNANVAKLVSELLKVMSDAYLKIMDKTLYFGKTISKSSKSNKNKKASSSGDTTDNSKTQKCWCTKWISKPNQRYTSPLAIYLPLNPKLNLNTLFNELDDKLFLGILGYNQVDVFWGERLMVVPGMTSNRNSEHPVQIRMSRQLLNKPRNRLIEALLFQMIRAFMFINKIEWNEFEYKKVLVRVQRQLQTPLEFNLSLVYEPEEYYRLLMETYKAKQRVVNKRNEVRNRLFAK